MLTDRFDLLSELTRSRLSRSQSLDGSAPITLKARVDPIHDTRRHVWSKSCKFQQIHNYRNRTLRFSGKPRLTSTRPCVEDNGLHTGDFQLPTVMQPCCTASLFLIFCTHAHIYKELSTLRSWKVFLSSQKSMNTSQWHSHYPQPRGGESPRIAKFGRSKSMQIVQAMLSGDEIQSG